MNQLSCTILLACALGATAPAAAQRILVAADPGASGGAVRGYRACTGTPDGLFISGLAGARAVRSGPTGDLFVVSEQNDNILRYDRSGVFLGVFVPAGSGGLDNPWDIAFGPNGNLFATNSASSGGPARIIQYHGATGALIGAFATAGSEIVEGLVFAPAGNLLAASLQANRIYEFHRTSGALLRTFTQGLSGPRGMAIGPDDQVYVANANGNSVTRIDLSTGAAATFVSPGSGGLLAPQQVAFGANGNLLVSSFGAGGIREYDGRSGGYLGELVPAASERYPVGVSVAWPGGVVAYGQSTPGCAGRPCAGASSAAQIGNSALALTCDDASAGAPGVLVFGLSALAAPITILGAELWVNTLGTSLLALVPVASNSQGSVTVPFPIPAVPSLAGFRMFTQFLWSDACAPGRVSASRALALTMLDATPACVPDAYEPNDTCASAAAIPLPTVLNAYICGAADEDWFQVALPGVRNLTVVLTPPQSPCANYDLELYSACGTLLASSTFAGCSTETIARNGAAAGTYRIRVRGNGAWHPSIPYNLSVQASTPAPITVTIPTSAPVTFSSSQAAYPLFGTHPVLQHAFTPGYAENVRVTLTGSAQQLSPCLSGQPWFHSRVIVNNGSWVIGATSLPLGTSAFSLSGTFTAQPGLTYGVMSLFSFNCAGFGGPMGAVPAQGTTAVLTITRTAL